MEEIRKEIRERRERVRVVTSGIPVKNHRLPTFSLLLHINSTITEGPDDGGVNQMISGLAIVHGWLMESVHRFGCLTLNGYRINFDNNIQLIMQQFIEERDRKRGVWGSS